MKNILYILAMLSLVSGCAQTPHTDKHHQLVSIKSTPTKANIYIDGALRGSTPLSLDLEVFQKKQTFMTAMPTVLHQFRQDITVAAGKLPDEILFFMDIPNTNIESEESEEQTENNFPCDPMIIPTLYFDIDVYDLNPNQRAQLSCFAQALAMREYSLLRVYGFADESHTFEYNIRLSIDRAKSTATVLTEFGISKKRINVIGMSEVNSYDESGARLSLHRNRKVMLEIVAEQRTSGSR